LREKFSGAADERESLGIFVSAWAFSHKNEFSFGISIAEDNGVAMIVKLAARAVAQVFANPQERVVSDFVGRVEQ